MVQLSNTGLDISPLPSFGHKLLPAVITNNRHLIQNFIISFYVLLRYYTIDIERNYSRKLFYLTSLEYESGKTQKKIGVQLPLSLFVRFSLIFFVQKQKAIEI